MRTIMVSSILSRKAFSCSVEPRAERSARLRVRVTHSSCTPPSVSTADMYADCAGAGTNKKVDNGCACAGVEGPVDCGGVKDGGSSRAPSPTASASAEERFCHIRTRSSRTWARIRRYIQEDDHACTESESGNVSVCASCEKRVGTGLFPL